MPPKQETKPQIKPITIDGKVIPGLFAFDSLPRNPSVERDIIIFSLEKKREAQQSELDKLQG